MNKYKKYISYVLYFASALAIFGVGLDTILISGKYIASEKEVNIYGLIYYFQFLFISIILWGFSFWLSPNKKIGIAYWLTFFIVTAFVIL